MSCLCQTPDRGRCACGPDASLEPRSGYEGRFSRPFLSSRRSSAQSSLLDHGHLDEVPDLLQLPDECRVNVLHDLVLMMVETHRLERRTHPPRMPDAATHLLDADLTGLRQLQLRSMLRTARAVPNECTRH